MKHLRYFENSDFINPFMDNNFLYCIKSTHNLFVNIEKNGVYLLDKPYGIDKYPVKCVINEFNTRGVMKVFLRSGVILKDGVTISSVSWCFRDYEIRKYFKPYDIVSYILANPTHLESLEKYLSSYQYERLKHVEDADKMGLL